MTADVRQHTLSHQHFPEFTAVFGHDSQLMGTEMPFDRMDWMMAEYESVPCIGMVRQGLIEPRVFHVPFASVSGPEGVDEDEK